LIILFSFVSLYAGATKIITIAGTADLQGMMEPTSGKFDLNFDGKREMMRLGGIDRIATLLSSIKKENPNSVIVTTGDDLMNRFFHTYRGKAILSLISDAGYDISIFGNHEFDKGSEVLAKALDVAKFEVLCSDLNVSGSDLNGRCKPYTIREFDGVKVGFFSMMTENFPMVTAEKDVTLISDNVTTAKKMVKILKDRDVDIIVALSHIGYKEDRRLAKQVKGIDLIFGGHSHSYIKKIGHINDTAIVNGGERGIEVVRVDIPLDSNNRVLHREIKMTKIAIDETIESNSTIKDRVSAYLQKFPKTTILGKTKAEWNMNSSTIRRGESNIADMINDMMRDKFQVDIVLNNSGAFRGGKIYKAGEVTDKMLKEIDEFRQYAYILKLQGKYLKPILEWSASSYGEGGFLQVSGIRYKINLSKQPMIVEGEEVIKSGDRVDNIEVYIDGSWQPIDSDRVYTILSNSFIVNRGGDGYFWFKKYGRDLQNTYASFYSIMADFLYRERVITPKATDGRIEILHI
jgi:5'-nucleotidase